MNNAFSLEDALLHVPQAIVAGRGDEVSFVNRAAAELFGPDTPGTPLIRLFPEVILQNPAEFFVASARLQDRNAVITVRRSGEHSLFYIDCQADSDDSLVFTRSMLSHLRNCATGLKLSADRCFAHLEEGTPPGGKSVSIFYHYYYRLARAITQLDSADKLKRGEMSFSPRLTDVGKLLSELMDTVESLFRDRKISFKFNCGPGRIIAGIDPDLFELAIFNLLANSLKSENDSTVIELSVRQSSGGILISLNDRGKGISAEELGKAFSPPEGGGAMEPEEGTGLGLYIAHSIIRLHGGVLLVEGSSGEGVNVRIHLPAPDENFHSLNLPEAEYRVSGMSPVLTGLADVLPTDCFGPKYED